MALRVKSETIPTNGKIGVFFLLLILLLIVTAILLTVTLFALGKLNRVNLVYFYTIFSPGTVILPVIVSLTSVLGFKRSKMKISPASNVNLDKLQEHFLKMGYRIVDEKPGFTRFERTSFLSRFLWFNLDQPIIEVTENDVEITLKKITEISLTPLIIYGSRFEIQLKPPYLPYLLLDKEICLDNIARMAAKAKKHDLIFRPHFKTHQSVEVGEWFKNQGVSQITVSSFRMAEYFALAGWNDITVAFPVTPFDAGVINRLAEKINLNIIFSSAANFMSAAELLKADVGAFVEIDTGQGRSGLMPDNNREIAILVNLINQKENLRFKGFITHAGHTYQAKGKDEVELVHQKTLAVLTRLKSFWRESYPEIIISYGDTPSCSIADEFWGIDEIRPGNFVFYDVMQWQIGSCSLNDIAIALICPVVDVYPERNEAIIRGGAVHLSKDSVVLPSGNSSFGLISLFDGKSWGEPIEGLNLEKVSQEHGLIKAANTESIITLKPGQLVAILPIHSCLTNDVMGELVLTDQSRVSTIRNPNISNH